MPLLAGAVHCTAVHAPVSLHTGFVFRGPWFSGRVKRDDLATIDAADLRAQRARVQVKLYELAPRVGVHPGELGAVLSGRRPLRAELALRISAALDAIATERRQ